MTIKKIQLVNAPNDKGVSSSGNLSCYPHLGLLSIATLLKRTHGDIDVEVIDGSITKPDEILSRLDADVIGVSVLTPTYANSLVIAEKAKRQGAHVVFGNDHASRLGRLILKKRGFVDGIVWGESGEIPFVRLIDHLKGKCPVEKVPNYIYKNHQGAVCSTPVQDFPMDSASIADRSFLEKPEIYQQNYQTLHGKWHSRPVRTTSINIARGCGWGQVNARRCIYCDIFDLKLRHVPVERAWEEVETLQNRFGINLLFEVCDSFTSLARQLKKDRKGQTAYLRRLVEAKPAHVNPEWHIYGRAQEITPDTVSLLEKLNVRKISIGIDSGDDRMLKTLSKGNPQGSETNLRAAGLLASAGINLTISLVLGSLGETEESLQNTVRHMEEMKRFGNVSHLSAGVLLAMPGSNAWRMMMDRAYARKKTRMIDFKPRFDTDFQKKYGEKDMLDLGEVLKDWVHTFCEVDYQTIKDCMGHISDNHFMHYDGTS